MIAKKIGLTGGIGAGKSAAAQIFRELGVPVYNSDIEAKRLMHTNADLIEDIKKLLGKEAYDPNNQLNRAFVANVIFSNPKMKEALEALVHPAVAKDFEDWSVQVSDHLYVLKEAAIIFETEGQKHLDEVILVVAPDSMRIKRVMQRDRVGKDQVLDRMRNQMPQEEKRKLTSLIIENDSNFEALKSEVLRVHQLLEDLYQ